MRFLGLFRSLVVCLALFVLAANAAKQDSVAVAHVIYDGSGLFYADNESKLQYKALNKAYGEDSYTIVFADERLKGTGRTSRKLRFGLGCNGSSCTADLNPEDQPYLGELFPAYSDSIPLKDKPVLEIWIVIKDDGTLDTYDTKPDIEAITPPKATIRFLTPWSSTNAIMYFNGKPYYMTTVPRYCGWFEAKVPMSQVDSINKVHFKQTIGRYYVGKDGMIKGESSVDDSIPTMSPEEELEIEASLLNDIVWVLAYQYGAPEIRADNHGVLGDCPLKTMPVMMFDWYDGSVNSDGTEDGLYDRKKGAGRNGFDMRGVPMFGTGVNQDFGQGGCEGNPMKGMVEKELGSNGLPVRKKENFPSGCKNSEHIDQWFVPQVIGHDAAGNEYTNVACREIDLTLTDDGFWFAEIDDNSPEGGLFLLDDFRWLDSAKTVENIHYDSIVGLSVDGVRKYHNFSYAMKIQATFQYTKGQYFEFNGDDDVWVFIDNKLVVDIGGQHGKQKGSVNLDKLGLIEDSTYNFHIFYAERKREASNFMMRTSIDLKVESNLILKDGVGASAKKIVKDVWQKVRERKLACDFDSDITSETLELGPSDFTLFGGEFPSGIKLASDSLYFNGIIVTDDDTKITIDIKKIGRNLEPGTYYVRVALKETKEYKDVFFTIDPYELPNLAFAIAEDLPEDSSYCIVNISEDGATEEDSVAYDSLCFRQFHMPLGDSISRNVSSDSLPINLDRTKKEKLWAGRIYPVNVMFVEKWAWTLSGPRTVRVIAKDPNLDICDSLGNIVDTIATVNGRGKFYVKASGAVVNGSIELSSSGAKNAPVWSNINIAEPPVPPIDVAYIFDNNGDGRADSIWIKLKRPVGPTADGGFCELNNSMKFLFDGRKQNISENTVNTTPSFVPVLDPNDSSIVTVRADGDGFSSSIFTGGKTEVYTGLVRLWYTYTDVEGNVVPDFYVDGDLQDHVGPVFIAAEVSYNDDGNAILKLTFSEGVNGDNASIDMFSFLCWRNSSLTSIVKEPSQISTSPKNQWSLVFTKGSENDVVPAVGDSVRFTPPSMGGTALDLVNIAPHEDNPLVRVTGEQKVTVTSPKVVALSRDSDNFQTAKEIIKSENATVPKLVPSDQVLSAEQVAAIYGTQGHYLGDLSMSQLVEDEIAGIIEAIKKTPVYTDKNNPTAPTTTIEDIIIQVGAGSMSIDEAKSRYGISDVIVEAYKNGLISAQNVTEYTSNDPDIKKIVKDVAKSLVLTYKTYYYTSLGHFVNEDGGTINCGDAEVFSNSNCVDNDGKLFLAWNMRSSSGRLAATGVYIARLEIKITMNGRELINRTQDFLWGVRRGQVNAIDLEL